MLGIVIVNYNSAEDTIKCINSIISTYNDDYLVSVVDNASTDNSCGKLTKLFGCFDNVEILFNAKNEGYAKGNNIGVKHLISRGCDYILISNSDIIYMDNALSSMIKAFENNVAVVGPRIVNTLGEDIQFASKLMTFKGYLLSKKTFSWLNLTSQLYYNYDRNKSFIFQGMVSGGCFMITVKDMTTINYFDEHTFLFHEESILAYKLKEYNRLTMITPDATVIHNHSSSIKKKGEAFRRYHTYCSAKYTLKQYAKLNKLQLFICSLNTVIPFVILSIFRPSYRVYIKKLLFV